MARRAHFNHEQHSQLINKTGIFSSNERSARRIEALAELIEKQQQKRKQKQKRKLCNTCEKTYTINMSYCIDGLNGSIIPWPTIEDFIPTAGEIDECKACRQLKDKKMKRSIFIKYGDWVFNKGFCQLFDWWEKKVWDPIARKFIEHLFSWTGEKAKVLKESERYTWLNGLTFSIANLFSHLLGIIVFLITGVVPFIAWSLSYTLVLLVSAAVPLILLGLGIVHSWKLFGLGMLWLIPGFLVFSIIYSIACRVPLIDGAESCGGPYR